MNQNKKTNRKLRLTPEEHKVLGPIMKQLVEDALLRYVSLSRKFPQQHKIVKLAKASHVVLDKMRSVLDDDICSYQEIADATSYYYP